MFWVERTGAFPERKGSPCESLDEWEEWEGRGRDVEGGGDDLNIQIGF